MLSFKTAVCLACLAFRVIVAECGSSSGRRGGTPAHDLTNKADLQHFLGFKVVNAEVVRRPLDGWKKEHGILSHSGVRGTLDNVSRHRMRKEKGVGISFQTVVTDARHMSSKRRPTGETRNTGGQKSVSDFIKAGGKRYSFVGNNCHMAKRSMMRQKVGGRRG